MAFIRLNEVIIGLPYTITFDTGKMKGYCVAIFNGKTWSTDGLGEIDCVIRISDIINY